MEPTGFRMFEFAPMGLILLAGGVLFLLTAGQRILPERTLLMAMITRERTAQFVTDGGAPARLSELRVGEAFPAEGDVRLLELVRYEEVVMYGDAGGGLPTISQGVGSGAVTPRVSGCMTALGVIGNVERLVSEHGTCDGEEPVCDGPQRSGMAVAARAESGVLCGAERVVLHGHSGPVIDCVLESAVSGEATDDDLRFARAPGDGSDAAQTAQSLVVAPLQRLVGLGEQRSEDDPSNPGQGGEDHGVTLPARLPRVGVSAFGQGSGEAVDLPSGIGELPLYEAEALRGAADVSDRGFGRPRSDRDRRSPQMPPQPVRVDASDPVTLEEAFEGAVVNPLAFCWGGHPLPELEEPGLSDVVGRLEDLGVVTPELLADAIGEPRAVACELLGDA